ncbi:MAG: ABC transporter ATP-binding protein, partial [Clostridia bacterium]|nr:ABC transporter ATP-binding protein [Clostridia bacterium]
MGPRRGPGPVAPKGERPDGKTIKRTLGYLAAYKWRFSIVIVCLVVSALTGVASSLFLRVLIDDHITPLLLEAVPDYSGLLTAIVTMAGIYLIGILSGFAYNRLMAVISQGVLRDIRDRMFSHMQTLPIKYFDTHTHGDIMSRYTNDTDTLRMMISQAIPQGISAVITIVSVFISMVSLSFPLTLLVIALAELTVFISGNIVGQSGKYFVKQQKCLGDMNGYIEEMISGQKVIKVFVHEDEAKAEFDRRNGELCSAATNAN